MVIIMRCDLIAKPKHAWRIITVDYPNNTELRKNRYLSFEECMTIQIRLRDELSAYKITKELNLLNNTILN